MDENKRVALIQAIGAVCESPALSWSSSDLPSVLYTLVADIFNTPSLETVTWDALYLELARFLPEIQNQAVNRAHLGRGYIFEREKVALLVLNCALQSSHAEDYVSTIRGLPDTVQFQLMALLNDLLTWTDLSGSPKALSVKLAMPVPSSNELQISFSEPCMSPAVSRLFTPTTQSPYRVQRNQTPQKAPSCILDPMQRIHELERQLDGLKHINSYLEAELDDHREKLEQKNVEISCLLSQVNLIPVLKSELDQSQRELVAAEQKCSEFDMLTGRLQELQQTLAAQGKEAEQQPNQVLPLPDPDIPAKTADKHCTCVDQTELVESLYRRIEQEMVSAERCRCELEQKSLHLKECLDDLQMHQQHLFLLKSSNLELLSGMSVLKEHQRQATDEQAARILHLESNYTDSLSTISQLRSKVNCLEVDNARLEKELVLEKAFSKAELERTNQMVQSLQVSLSSEQANRQLQSAQLADLDERLQATLASSRAESMDFRQQMEEARQSLRRTSNDLAACLDRHCAEVSELRSSLLAAEQALSVQKTRVDELEGELNRTQVQMADTDRELEQVNLQLLSARMVLHEKSSRLDELLVLRCEEMQLITDLNTKLAGMSNIFPVLSSKSEAIQIVWPVSVVSASETDVHLSSYSPAVCQVEPCWHVEGWPDSVDMSRRLDHVRSQCSHLASCISDACQELRSLQVQRSELLDDLSTLKADFLLEKLSVTCQLAACTAETSTAQVPIILHNSPCSYSMYDLGLLAIAANSMSTELSCSECFMGHNHQNQLSLMGAKSFDAAGHLDNNPLCLAALVGHNQELQLSAGVSEAQMQLSHKSICYLQELLATSQSHLVWQDARVRCVQHGHDQWLLEPSNSIVTVDGMTPAITLLMRTDSDQAGAEHRATGFEAMLEAASVYLQFPPIVSNTTPAWSPLCTGEIHTSDEPGLATALMASALLNQLLTTENRSITEELEVTRTQLGQQAGSLERLQFDAATLEETCVRLQKDLHVSASTTVSLQTTLHDLHLRTSKEKASSAEVVSELQQELTIAKEMLSNALRRNQSHMEDADLLKRSLAETQARALAAETERAALAVDLAASHDHLVTSQQHCSQMEERMRVVDKDRTELLEEVESLRSIREERGQYENNIKTLQKDKVTTLRMYEASNTKLRELKSENAALKKEIDAQQSSLAALRKELETSLQVSSKEAGFEHDLLSLRQENSELKSMLNNPEVANQLRDTSRELRAAREILKARDSELESLRLLLSSLKQELGSKSSSLAHQETEISRLREQLIEEQSRNRSQAAHVRSVEDQFNYMVRVADSNTSMNSKSGDDVTIMIQQQTVMSAQKVRRWPPVNGVERSSMYSTSDTESFCSLNAALADGVFEENTRVSTSTTHTPLRLGDSRRRSLRYMGGNTPPERRTTLGSAFLEMGPCQPELEPDVDNSFVEELKRRNTLCLPHMRSSYPIQLMNHPSAASITDNSLKVGSRVSAVGSSRSQALSQTALDFGAYPSKLYDSLHQGSLTDLRQVPASTSRNAPVTFEVPSGTGSRRESLPMKLKRLSSFGKGGKHRQLASVKENCPPPPSLRLSSSKK